MKLRYAPADVKSAEQVMEFLGINERVFKALQAALQTTHPMSLDQSFRADREEGSMLSEVIADPTSEPDLTLVDLELAAARIEALLLPSESELLKLAAEGRTQVAIARQLGITKSAVRHRLGEARNRVRAIAPELQELVTAA